MRSKMFSRTVLCRMEDFFFRPEVNTVLTNLFYTVFTLAILVSCLILTMVFFAASGLVSLMITFELAP